MWQTIKRCFFKIQSIYFIFWSVPGLCCYVGFSLVASSGGHFPVMAQGLLLAVASPVAEHVQLLRTSGIAAPGLRRCIVVCSRSLLLEGDNSGPGLLSVTRVITLGKLLALSVCLSPPLETRS